jgi:hypothetical protein
MVITVLAEDKAHPVSKDVPLLPGSVVGPLNIHHQVRPDD